MPITATSEQQLLVLEVGDTPTGLLATYAGTVWAAYTDKAQIAPRLQRAYTKRTLIDIALGAARYDVDFADAMNVSIRSSQRVTALVAMRVVADAEIVRIEAKAKASRGMTTTPITQVAPELSPTVGTYPTTIDANSPYYQGDPYFRTTTRNP